MSDKRVCQDCHWRGVEGQVLSAPNPFAEDEVEQISGCPECRAVESMNVACDEPDCWRPVSCGTPVPGGKYRSTCYDHAPKGSRS